VKTGEDTLHATFLAPHRSRRTSHPMADPLTTQLSRRERQIMDVIYRHGRVTAAEVMAELPEPPSYSAVRAMLRLLEEKGHVKHEQDGPRYVYVPTVGRDKARRSAMRHLVRTFFDGSTEDAVAALLQNDSGAMSDDELERLSQLIEGAKKEGR
jgi:BlaI family transcriptional regulator, penicillinase repressor